MQKYSPAHEDFLERRVRAVSQGYLYTIGLAFQEVQCKNKFEIDPLTSLRGWKEVMDEEDWQRTVYEAYENHQKVHI